MPHEAHDYQVRITDDDARRVLEAMEFYLTDRHMVFKHTPRDNPENVHYHMYIFGLYRTAESVRNRLANLGYQKSRYSVSSTAGRRKEKITPEKAYVYGFNPKSNPVLVKIEGFSDEEIKGFEEAKDLMYNPPIVASPSDVPTTEVIFRVDRVWERLRNNVDDYKHLTVKAIKSRLCAEWLNDGKAIPRPSDLHRYACSLYMINKYEKEGYVPYTAFEEGGFFDYH